MRLGVKNGTQTTSNVFCSPACATARTPLTARNSVSTTFRKSRGAKRSVGVTMSVLPQRMNCLPTSTVKRTARDRRGHPADRQRGPQPAPVAEVDAPGSST